MSEKFPIYLTKIEISPEGDKKFVKGEKPYQKTTDKAVLSKLMFKFRRAFFDGPNCNFNCPPGREFYCCKEFNCVAHYGFFTWNEIQTFPEEVIEEILSYWNNGTGFLRKNGCALPRELRSCICLEWRCPHSEEVKE